MAPDGSEIDPADEKLALELWGGKKVAEAAGLSERTAYRRMNDPAFQERMRELRRGVSDRVMHLLARAAVDAVEALHMVATSHDDTGLRLKAAATRAAASARWGLAMSGLGAMGVTRWSRPAPPSPRRRTPPCSGHCAGRRRR